MPEALDAVGEIEIDAEAGFADAAACIALCLGGAGSDVARARGCRSWDSGVRGNSRARLRESGRAARLSPCLFGNPDAAVVAERLGHQGELGLILAGDGDAGGVDLREAGIGEKGAALVGAPDGGGVAALGVGGKVEDVAIAAGGENDGVGHVDFDFAVVEVASDDAAGLAVDDDQVEHFRARIHLDGAEADLAFEGLVGAEKKLLAGLAAGVKGAGNLRAAEGAVVEQAAVFAGEGHALSDALVDDVDADLGKAIDVGFAGAEVAALDGVVEEADKRCRRRCDNSWRR